MISADDYIVQVQDFGELLEYRYNDYAKARHLMDVEALPCSLWACCRATGERVQLENRMTRGPCSAEPFVKRLALWYNQSGELEGLPNERSDAASRKPTGFLQNGGGRHGRI